MVGMTLQPDDLPDNQLQYAHLKPVCHIALRQCGILQADIQFISDTANVIFQARTADQAYCIRICQQEWTLPELHGELLWLSSLVQETDLIVPTPIMTRSGQLIQEIALPEKDELFQVVIFHWIQGEIIGTHVDTEIVRHVGRLMGELHNHAATFELPPDVDRDRTDWLGMGQLLANMKTVHAARIKAFLNPSQLDLCNEAAQRAASIINKIDAQQNFGLIHSDLHMGNCLLTEGGIGIIDFDDCQFAPFTCDLAITISDFDYFDNRDALRDVFLQGYSEKRPFPPNYVAEIEAFRIERRLRLIRWVSTWPSVDHFSFGQEVIDTSLRQCEQYIYSK